MSAKESLQNPSEWDWDKSETREPVRHRRVVLSVAFQSPEFQRVASYAAKIGKRTSEFVREAAIQAVPATHPNVIPFPATAFTSTQGTRTLTSDLGDPMTSPAVQYQLR